ncbi:hypothetical protein DM02DRAFT_618372 [Periconia macrospinosa]|uniref:Integral membrane protein n=1 Tax=Periconia macrospinosa TaxID=97972 RepID=A0A2V1D9M3_9PLEO|nr:hypothetical protein DM02DRAFT_618372 [Periconia macrospinosa]
MSSGRRNDTSDSPNNPRPHPYTNTTSTSTTTTTTTHQGPTYTTTTSHVWDGQGGSTTTTTNAPPSGTVVHHPTVTTTHQIPLSQPLPPPPTSIPHRLSTIGIRRPSVNQPAQTPVPVIETDSDIGSRRRRSSSEPQRPPLALLDPRDDLEIRRQLTGTAQPLQTLHEENSNTQVPQLSHFAPIVPSKNPARPALPRQASASAFNLRRAAPQDGQGSRDYDTDLVNLLDVIDPEVSTLTTLNNVQNSLFIPNLGWLYNRRPTYDFAPSPSDTSDEEQEMGMDYGPQDSRQQLEGTVETEAEDEDEEEGAATGRPSATRLQTTNTITSVMTSMEEGQGHNYAVLPHGASLPGWTDEEKAMLNDHVRHLLHSRREKFKRGMRGFGRYVRKPLGFLVTLYAFLLFLFGLAWVLFLIGWISVGGRQAYFIEICDQVLTALFCVVGIGMAPWRAIDTYHMIFVAKYAHKTWRVRRERGLPALKDHNELPHCPPTHPWKKDESPDPQTELPVLSPAEQQKLEHHQNKLADSHTFYKPHETYTHNAFSVRLLIAIVVLLDCHSLFQMALGGTTWGIYYKVRPKALTAVILSCSISCNISAGVTISIGDRRSRKTLVIEQMFRQGLTEEALKKLKKEKGLVASGVGRRGSKTGKGKGKKSS